ncbi:MAG: response regulator [Candidatus Anammoxibacter sp.]
MASILIIDDDDQLRGMLRQMLEHDGHTVTEARNGNEGVEFFSKDPSDLVITDMIMPGKDGVETSSELLLNHPAVKIIGLTGGGLKGFDYLNEAKSYGVLRTLSKPFGMKEMLAAVDEVLNK